MQLVFFISDHHFGHKQIIDFESRPAVVPSEEQK
ncbi:hypothetical protein SAMN05428962_2462 [Paenibacillus sp. BC26]|nr:hypothetical protein SAMN05428962_2462 [Paenibacillus sp. BC26]